ncbi:diacylglycerol/lipid kinase family protein [Microbacterium marinilacus]|uniref:YegS/Rv2252/BmrU family lipid kinase n=1 Tax=Microbacterium marinilacus TaxID=415209 RepID=A0ABP7BLF2_9MICO|nr:diacylglycerol kinase family protein [Microbacterium marinilacus]MBY0688321.1 diacylglycerol kinase [Microbacterium marinilacus]
MEGEGGRRIGLVVNPAAGRGAGRRVGVDVARALDEAGHVLVGLSALSAEDALAQVGHALAEGLDALVVVGGDGMVHLGVQALAGTQVPLGIIPVGTGNDFAAAAGIPRDTAGAVSILLRGLRRGGRSVDLLRVTGGGVDRAPGVRDSGGGVLGGTRWVAGAVSAGLDAAVNARANGMRWPHGSARYVLAALREIFAYRSWDYALEATGVTVARDGRGRTSFPGMRLGDAEAGGAGALRWKSRGALVTAANGRSIGGGIRIAPSARVDDGLLDLVMARDVGRLTAARLFPLMLLGAHLRSRHLRAVRARKVTVRSGRADAATPPVYGDGEPIGTLPIQVEVFPGSLTLLA